MQMRTGALLLSLAASTALSGCCTAYKTAVAKYADTLQERDKIMYGTVEPELRKELVLNDSALKCLVVKDQKTSKGSAACRCSDGKPDEWQANCADWLK